MKYTLILSLASWCEGLCPGCSFQPGTSSLPVDALQKVLEILDRLDESVVICSWSRHPDLHRMARMLFEKSRRVVWLISPGELGNLAKNKVPLTFSDEFFVVLHKGVDTPVKDHLKALVSSTCSLRSLRSRLSGVGVLTKEEAKRYSVVGPARTCARRRQ